MPEILVTPGSGDWGFVDSHPFRGKAAKWMGHPSFFVYSKAKNRKADAGPSTRALRFAQDDIVLCADDFRCADALPG